MSAEAADVSAQTSQTPAAPQLPARDGTKATTHERLKMLLGDGPGDVAPNLQAKAASDVGSDAGDGESLAADRQVPDKAKAATDQADDAVDEVSDDAQSEDWKPSNLTELLEAAGLDSDKGYDLELPVKIDGKEGTAKIRDLLKSYQLDGHINQKLAALDTDRKAFMEERTAFQGERAEKLLRMDAGIQTLERALLGEFQAVDWNKLAAEDPAAYNSKFVDFQQRNAYLSDIGRQIAQEREHHQQQQAQAYAEKLAEERRLMAAKIPEWANETTRAKDKAEIGAYLETVGIGKQEFEAIDDHRFALVARDAAKWHALQKGKPAVLQKVKAAPRLLKPGAQQSKDVVNQHASNKERERLRQTGRVGDAVAPLKRLLFN